MFRTALISMFLTSTALADTWTVDDDGKADFDNIQAAIDASSDGDEVVGVGDILGVISHWLSADQDDLIQYDVDEDGQIRIGDILFIIAHWGCDMGG